MEQKGLMNVLQLIDKLSHEDLNHEWNSYKNMILKKRQAIIAIQEADFSNKVFHELAEVELPAQIALFKKYRENIPKMLRILGIIKNSSEIPQRIMKEKDTSFFRDYLYLVLILNELVAILSPRWYEKDIINIYLEGKSEPLKEFTTLDGNTTALKYHAGLLVEYGFFPENAKVILN